MSSVLRYAIDRSRVTPLPSVRHSSRQSWNTANSPSAVGWMSSSTMCAPYSNAARMESIVFSRYPWVGGSMRAAVQVSLVRPARSRHAAMRKECDLGMGDA